MGTIVTEIQTNLHTWACCNQYAMCVMFHKVAEINVGILDDRLFFCVFTVIFMK